MLLRSMKFAWFDTTIEYVWCTKLRNMLLVLNILTKTFSIIISFCWITNTCAAQNLMKNVYADFLKIWFDLSPCLLYRLMLYLPILMNDERIIEVQVLGSQFILLSSLVLNVMIKGSSEPNLSIIMDVTSNLK